MYIKDVSLEWTDSVVSLNGKKWVTHFVEVMLLHFDSTDGVTRADKFLLQILLLLHTNLKRKLLMAFSEGLQRLNGATVNIPTVEANENQVCWNESVSLLDTPG